MLQPVSMPFDACIERPPIFDVGRVSRTCLVSVDRNRYSVPAEWTGKVVSVRISAHGIKVVADGELVARHERKFGRNQLICEPRFTKSWALERIAFDQIRSFTLHPEAAIALANAFGVQGEFE